ncbi:hemolysin family protein [Sulfurihydrogenibium sp.]|uniref:hemolysin family protein n=1 Tax=Sulfurihydrogenibium sp. TaxID=2053621 RepID=UPI002636BF9C|nr:hemolysin family protein [Sulfurihydrogenibium sp.]
MEGRFIAISSDLLINFAVVFLFILTAGFFAAVESSFFSLDRLKIKRLSEKGNKSAKIVEFLRNHPKELVITFLIGNELANVAATSLIASLTITYLGKEYLLVGSFISALLLLSLGDITPKIIGTNYPEKYALTVSKPFYLFYVIITPFRVILLKTTQWILNKFGIQLLTEEHKITEEDYKFIIHNAADLKVITEEEKELIDNAFELSEKTVIEIMVPRRDIFAVEKGISIRQLAELLENKDYSRIPVYEGDLDNIVGILHLKDIIFLILEGKEEKIDSFIRPAIFLPEFTTLLDAMKKFNETKQHLAIVVNEHGTTIGLLTYKDIIESIVGDIPEEFEIVEPAIKQISENTWIVSGKTDVEFLTDELGILLPEDYDYDTVAGFVLSQFKDFPHEGESFEYQGYKFTVIQMSFNRVEKVQIEKIENQTPHEENGEKNA